MASARAAGPMVFSRSRGLPCGGRPPPDAAKPSPGQHVAAARRSHAVDAVAVGLPAHARVRAVVRARVDPLRVHQLVLGAAPQVGAVAEQRRGTALDRGCDAGRSTGRRGHTPRKGLACLLSSLRARCSAHASQRSTATPRPVRHPAKHHAEDDVCHHVLLVGARVVAVPAKPVAVMLCMSDSSPCVQHTPSKGAREQHTRAHGAQVRM